MNTDIIIVGQGLAGTLVANACIQSGKKVMVIDPGLPITSSRVAAGMFTPVSGKRMALTPNANELMAEVFQTYTALEKLLGVSFLHQQPIYHIFSSVKEQNDLMGRMDDPNFVPYVNAHPVEMANVNQPFGAFEVNASGWLNTNVMLDAFRNYLRHDNSIMEEEFEYSALHHEETAIHYKQITAKQIVFCEGYKIKDNPFFQHISIIPCKGEVFQIACAHGPHDRIVKKGCYMVENIPNQYKVGSTYEWGNESLDPSIEGKEQLLGKLNDMIALPFEVLSHVTGIRPTTKDRKPIAVQHPEYKNMFVLNGLGTKGVLQGPHWTKKLMELLLKTNSSTDGGI